MYVIIAICTYKRYKSLQRCIESLQMMAIPSNINVEIVVIDNEPTQIVANICQENKVKYIPEPQRGLVFARNSVLDYARSKNPDYLGIIDDDETVSVNWLHDMLNAFDTTKADALAGIIDIHLTSPMPRYLKTAYQFKKVKKITLAKTLPMGNVMLRNTIIQTDILFNKKFNFTGGEDIDFFTRLYKQGKKLYKIPNAEVIEYLMPEKASLTAYFNRQMRVAKLHYAEKYPFFSLQFLFECFLSIIEILFAFFMLPFENDPV